jgi:hypothetical protein
MRKAMAGGAGVLFFFIGHVQASEITCPAVTDIHRNIESVEDVFLVEHQTDRQWSSQSLVDVVDSQSLKFNGAEYVIHEDDQDEQAPTRATITCRYGPINLTSEYQNLQVPTYSHWRNHRCESADPEMCKLINADYFNVSFES